MTKIFIINAGEHFLHARGKFNTAVTAITTGYFSSRTDAPDIQVTTLKNGYLVMEEVEKYKWADLIIYHTPIWWFNIPHGLKRYFEVLSAGRLNGLSKGDGRSSENPAINYGTGGRLTQKPYLVTASMNAPENAFTAQGGFFSQHSVDDGILFGFHRMHAYMGMRKLESFHFYDLIKNANTTEYLNQYKLHLEKINRII
ncbi:NADPH quinone reductase MdaB [Pedobacter petrophilus]|uniref:NADPH quinone reductase MdaB n=1 Tax=Pedobacter petrophilus TaxID=1908241 RepID=A0A7K0FWW5_9SPHI|nr:NADPH quinone reductase MdaB [Pedobacter petrophilus]